MSYREPKIIDDKSGLVLGQAIAAGAQNISKGIIAGQARKEKEEAKKKLEAERKLAKEQQRISQTSKAIKDSYADQAAWAEKLNGNLEGLNDFTVEQMNGYMEVAKNLELERINGAYGPDYLKRLEENQKNIAMTNEFASGIIGARADAGAVIDMTEKQRTSDTAFIPVYGDTGELAEDAVYAIGGLKGYKIGYDKTKGVRITRPGEDDAFIDMKTWNSISGNLYYHRKDNTTTDMQGIITETMQVENSAGKMVLDTNMISTTPVGIGTGTVIPGIPLEPISSGVKNGYYTFKQPFNKEAVDNLKNKVMQGVFEKIESFGPETYKQNVWMKDLERGGFNKEAYAKIEADVKNQNPNATEADITAVKKQYVIDSAEAQFLAIANLKKDGDEYYRTIQGQKVPSASKSAGQKQINFATADTEFKNAIAAAEGERPSFRELLANVGSIVESGDIYIDGKKTIRNVNTFGANGITVAWGQPDYPDTATGATIKAAELVRAGKPMNVVEIEGEDYFAKDVAAKDANSISVDLSNRSQALGFMENILRVERNQAIKLYDTYYK